MQGAIVVGHSMGVAVAVALAEQASQLVDRVVNIGEGPTEDSCEVPFLAKLALRAGARAGDVADHARLRGRGRLRRGVRARLRPRSGFPNPDQVVDDLRAMTYTSFDERPPRRNDYLDEIPLDERVTSAAVPLLSIFGAEDQICDAEPSQAAYERCPARGSRRSTAPATPRTSRRPRRRPP